MGDDAASQSVLVDDGEPSFPAGPLVTAAPLPPAATAARNIPERIVFVVDVSAEVDDTPFGGDHA